MNHDDLPGDGNEGSAVFGEIKPTSRDGTDEISKQPNRRGVLRQGARLAFVAPLVLTFSAQQAMAAGSNQSCYPAGHACPGNEPCCDDMTCNAGVCGDACGGTAELCMVDSDCCSGDCDLGTCQ